jgi:hypothetical protein
MGRGGLAFKKKIGVPFMNSPHGGHLTGKTGSAIDE